MGMGISFFRFFVDVGGGAVDPVGVGRAEEAPVSAAEESSATTMDDEDSS